MAGTVINAARNSDATVVASNTELDLNQRTVQPISRLDRTGRTATDMRGPNQGQSNRFASGLVRSVLFTLGGASVGALSFVALTYGLWEAAKSALASGAAVHTEGELSASGDIAGSVDVNADGELGVTGIGGSVIGWDYDVPVDSTVDFNGQIETDISGSVQTDSFDIGLDGMAVLDIAPLPPVKLVVTLLLMGCAAGAAFGWGVERVIAASEAHTEDRQAMLALLRAQQPRAEESNV